MAHLGLASGCTLYGLIVGMIIGYISARMENDRER